jgi:hypothetical protein
LTGRIEIAALPVSPETIACDNAITSGSLLAGRQVFLEILPF